MKELLKKLRDNDIDFSQYILLYSLFHGDKQYAEEYNKVEIYDSHQGIQKLIHLGFLARVELLEGTSRYTDFTNDNLFITKLGIERFFKESTSAPSNESILPKYKILWIEDWYDLFPKGIKSGGYYVRTSIKDCDKKMFKFLIDNSEFTKDIILEATKNYIEDMKSKNYSMMKLAPNFIYKDGISMLSGACEAYVQGVNNNQDTYSTNELTGI
tara:strand:+ start:3719 stop:4357 length:639 start_codon:yes stop_codon:yes gene_type:complete